MRRILKVFAIILGSVIALLLTFLLLFLLFIEIKIAPPSKRFIGGVKITSPNLQKIAYVYTIDSPMAFGSESTRLCVLGKNHAFNPDDNYSLYNGDGFSAIGWKGSDTLMIRKMCDYHQHTDTDEIMRKPNGLWVEYKKFGGITLEIYHFKLLSSGLNTFEIDSLLVRGDSLFITTTQSWDEWKYFSVNLGSVTIDRSTTLIDTLEVVVMRTNTNEKYRQPTASFYYCNFTLKKPIRTALFDNLPVRERLQRSQYRK